MLTKTKMKLHVMWVCLSVTATCIKSDAVLFVFVIHLTFQLENRNAELKKKHSATGKRITQVQYRTSRQTNRATIKHLVCKKYHTHRWWKSRSAYWQRPYEPWQNVWKKLHWPVNKLLQPYLCCGMWNKILSLSFTAFPSLSSRYIHLWHCRVGHLFSGQAVMASTVQASRYNSVY